MPEEETKDKPRLVNSLQDLEIVESFDPGASKPTAVTFFHITKDEEVYFGETKKSKFDTTLDEFNSALQRIPDHEIFPGAPPNIELKIAPDLTDSQAWIKRPGLSSYDTFRGTDFVPQSMLDETLIMEQILKSPHPNFVDSVDTPAFDALDKIKFVDDLESAVKHLHTLGLAHNDINPHNIMIKEGMPVLIDFGSCQPFGKRLSSLGTAEWYEKEFRTSEKEHDDFGIKKLRDWIQNPD